jgi:ribulose 1,5-bisphosphate synthetase/thiazole synthase
MWAARAESRILQHTKEIYPGLVCSWHGGKCNRR